MPLHRSIASEHLVFWVCSFGGDTVAVVSDYLVYLVVMLIEKRMMVVSGVISILLSLICY